MNEPPSNGAPPATGVISRDASGETITMTCDEHVEFVDDGPQGDGDERSTPAPSACR